MKLIGNQRGSEGFYTLAGFTVLIVVLFVSYSIAVPFFKNMSLEGFSQKLVNYDYQNDRPNATGAKSIYNKLVSFIKKKNMPISESQMAVDYDKNSYSVKITYEHPVNLIVYSFDWEFSVYKTTMENY